MLGFRPAPAGPGARRPGERLQHPARVIASGFGAVALVGTLLLALPVSSRSGRGAGLVDALFTSVSAVCLTGLATVDTGSYWSTSGQVVILALMQVGGLGIMAMATLFAILVSGRLGLRTRLLIQAETKSLRLRDLRRLLRSIVLFSLAAEAVAAGVLTARLTAHYDRPWRSAAWEGVFHAVSAFNNAGFSLNADNLAGYVTDPWVSVTVALASILGGLGFPVVFELARAWRRPGQWSVLTYLTLGTSAVLVVVGTALFTVTEYSNPATLGRLDFPGKLLAGFFTAVMPRSCGMNTIDISALTPESMLVTDIFMFIGGGSAGTAGGIKVTTFALLAFVIWAEMRGETQVHVGRRRLPEANQRQALSVALLGVGLVALSTLVLLALGDHPLDRVLFEATSAFGTVGLSTGITADLGHAGQLVLVALMFTGRLGPLTLASALALRERARRYELPEERTIVG